MRIGILLCEKFEAPRATCPEAPEYADEFLKMLKSAQTPSDMLSIETFYVKENQYPGDICDFDKYIITGSLASAYTNSGWILGLKQFCREAAGRGAKLIGICFGHQLLAEAFFWRKGRARQSRLGCGQAGIKAHGGQLSCKVFPQGRVCPRIQPPQSSRIPAAKLKNTLIIFFLPYREFVNREFRTDISGASRIRRHLR